MQDEARGGIDEGDCLRLLPPPPRPHVCRAPARASASSVKSTPSGGDGNHQVGGRLLNFLIVTNLRYLKKKKCGGCRLAFSCAASWHEAEKRARRARSSYQQPTQKKATASGGDSDDDDGSSSGGSGVSNSGNDGSDDTDDRGPVGR